MNKCAKAKIILVFDIFSSPLAFRILKNIQEQKKNLKNIDFWPLI